MTTAEIDALIARLNALAEDLPDESEGWWGQLSPYWCSVIKDGVCPTLTKSAAALAALKADAERIRAQTIEECAMVCDKLTPPTTALADWVWGKQCCADAIRALLASEKE